MYPESIRVLVVVGVTVNMLELDRCRGTSEAVDLYGVRRSRYLISDRRWSVVGAIALSILSLVLMKNIVEKVGRSCGGIYPNFYH